MPNPSARLLLIPFTLLFVLSGAEAVMSPSILNVALTILTGIAIAGLARQARREARENARGINSSDTEIP